MRNISNSEVNTWLHCRRKYWYEYMMDLEPKQQSTALSKGTLIHACLEQYYLEKMDGSDEATCREAIQPVIMAAARDNELDIVEIGKARSLLELYFDFYELTDSERYEVVAVETKFSVPMIDDVFALAGTIDAVFLDKEDGRHVAVDHKSSYNFWSEDQASISGQFVKYTYALRERGFDIKAFMINQIRTRELKAPVGTDLFRRLMVKPSDTRIRNVISQHVQVGAEIIDFRQRGVKEAAIPIFDKFGCANCQYLLLCDSDSEGAPTDYLIQSEFQLRKSYGYNHAAPE